MEAIYSQSPSKKHLNHLNIHLNDFLTSSVYEQLFVERELKDSFVAEDFWLGFSGSFKT